MTAVASKLWRHGRSSLILVVILIAVALSAPWMAPYDPNRIDVLARDQGLSALHWLGTDHLGRDVLSRILLGTQLALGVALVVVTAALAVGTLLGVLAASAPRQGERACSSLSTSSAPSQASSSRSPSWPSSGPGFSMS